MRSLFGKAPLLSTGPTRNTPSTPLRRAVAGAGVIGQAHIAVIQAHPVCALSAIVDPSPAAAAIAARAGVPQYPTLDAPIALHMPQALQCIDAGVPCLVEKPIATTVAEGQRLVDAVARTGAKVLSGHHRAHSPIMVKARQVIDSGQLGRLVGVMGSATFYKPDHYFAEGPWRTQPGGGPILINMIHEVHNLRMLCGDIVAVQAFTANATRGFAVEDTVAIKDPLARQIDHLVQVIRGEVVDLAAD